MRLGILKSITPGEARIPLVPQQLQVLIQAGAQVVVESKAGARAGYADAEFEAVGAQVVYDPLEALARAEVAIGAERPLPSALGAMERGSSFLGLLHAGIQGTELRRAAAAAGVALIALEDTTPPRGLAALRPQFAQVAGALLPQVAGALLQSDGVGGFGKLIPAIPGYPSAEVVIVGAGALGHAAARTFAGLGAQCTLLDTAPEGLERAHAHFGARVQTRLGGRGALLHAIGYADVLILAARVQGDRAPRILSRGDLAEMRPGALLIDMAIDRGGNAETSRPMGHPREAERVEGILHFAMPNLSSLVARRGSQIFSATLCPWLLAALKGGALPPWMSALPEEEGISPVARDREETP